MNNYINYDYYTNTFGGKLIPQDEFDKYATNASMRVRTRIFNRDISNFKNAVQFATCLVAEILYNQDLNKTKLQNLASGSDKQITSEKVGDYSRNIANTSFNDLKEYCSDEYVDKQIEDELENNLFYTGLLYGGIPYV